MISVPITNQGDGIRRAVNSSCRELDKTDGGCRLPGFLAVNGGALGLASRPRARRAAATCGRCTVLHSPLSHCPPGPALNP